MHFAEEHIASYYAATVDDQTDNPRLREHIKVDVCVVGGGFTGVAKFLSVPKFVDAFLIDVDPAVFP